MNLISDLVAGADDKAPNTTDDLPPITKETTATVGASMVPSAPAQSTITNAPAAPSSDATAKPEVPASADEGQEASANEPSKTDTTAAASEKTSGAVPAPVPQSATTGAVASGTESNGPKVGLPKPVSVEEVRDEELPNAKPLESEKPKEGASKTDGSPANESDESAVVGKRKVDEADDTAKPETKSAETDGTEPPEKKPKTNGTTTNGTARKPGRPKKDKTAAPLVGRTARKTRSQGAAD